MWWVFSLFCECLLHSRSGGDIDVFGFNELTASNSNYFCSILSEFQDNDGRTVKLSISFFVSLCIWMLWKRVVSSKENEKGGEVSHFTLVWMCCVFERIALFEEEFKSISSNPGWFQRKMMHNTGTECEDGIRWGNIRKERGDPFIWNWRGMNGKWIAECDFHQIHTNVEISKSMKERVSHKSVVHVALSGTVGYEPSVRRCVWVQEQIGRRVSGLCGCLG